MAKSKVKFVLNKAGVIQMLKSDEMEAALNTYGEKVAGRAGNGYGHKSIMSGDRVKCFVSAETDKAKRDNMKNNTLLKALGGGQS